MRQRIFSSMLTLMLLALLTGSTRSSAQIGACLTQDYTVDIQANVHADCYPIVVKTSWGGGNWTGITNTFYPGIFVVNPGAPTGTPLDFIDVCGTTINPVPGQTTVICGTCKLCVVVCTDPSSGCMVIKIYLGPCPAAPLPCP